MKPVERRIQIWAIVLLLLAIAAELRFVSPPSVSAQGGSFPCYIGGGTGSTASTNSTGCKQGYTTVTGVRVINTTATLAYLRLYNAALGPGFGPTCSSATGFVETIPIPASATGAGLVDVTMGVGYQNGLGFCLTGGGGNNDNTNAPAGVYGVVKYQ